MFLAGDPEPSEDAVDVALRALDELRPPGTVDPPAEAAMDSHLYSLEELRPAPAMDPRRSETTAGTGGDLEDIMLPGLGSEAEGSPVREPDPSRLGLSASPRGNGERQRSATEGQGHAHLELKVEDLKTYVKTRTLTQDLKLEGLHERIEKLASNLRSEVAESVCRRMEERFHQTLEGSLSRSCASIIQQGFDRFSVNLEPRLSQLSAQHAHHVEQLMDLRRQIEQVSEQDIKSHGLPRRSENEEDRGESKSQQSFDRSSEVPELACQRMEHRFHQVLEESLSKSCAHVVEKHLRQFCSGQANFVDRHLRDFSSDLEAKHARIAAELRDLRRQVATVRSEDALLCEDQPAVPMNIDASAQERAWLEQVRHNHALHLVARGKFWYPSWTCAGCHAECGQHFLTVRRCSKRCRFNLCEACYRKRILLDAGSQRVDELVAASLSQWIYAVEPQCDGVEAPLAPLPDWPSVSMQVHFVEEDLTVGSIKVAAVTAHLPGRRKVLYLVFKGTSSLQDVANWNPEHEHKDTGDAASFIHKGASGMIRNLHFLKIESNQHVLQAVEGLYEAGTHNLILTGHSLGGLYATACLYWIHKENTSSALGSGATALATSVRAMTFGAPMCFGSVPGKTQSAEFLAFEDFANKQAVNFMNHSDPCPRAWSAVGIRDLAKLAAEHAKKDSMAVAVLSPLVDMVSQRLVKELERVEACAKDYRHVSRIRLLSKEGTPGLHWSRNFKLQPDGFKDHLMSRYQERLLEASDQQEQSCHVLGYGDDDFGTRVPPVRYRRRSLSAPRNAAVIT